MAPRSIAVVGGGVTGLVAARSLARAGTSVTLFESGGRLGGQIKTVSFLGYHVDTGAEALHLAGPPVAALIDDLGLGGQAISANPGSAWIWTGHRLRRLPAGVGPAGPTRLWPVMTSRLLSPRGLARAAVEPLLPAGRHQGDTSVGAFLGRRFGHQVVDRLVDPVLGSLHAGDVSRLSLQAATPYVAAQVADHRSLLLAHRGRRGPGPSFLTFPRGLGALVEALAGDPGVTIVDRSPVEAVDRRADRYAVIHHGGAESSFDGVVLALPAGAAARVLGELCPPAATTLSTLNTASVATVVAAYPRATTDRTPALTATGLLVPSRSGFMLKAATFLSSKWPHLDDPDFFLVRLSAGRAGSDEIADLDDSELVGRLQADLEAMTGLDAEPDRVHVERWPRALAQLEVGHRDRWQAIRHHLAPHPGVVLAGAPYEGIGIATCLRSGQAAAARLLDHLGLMPSSPP